MKLDKALEIALDHYMNIPPHADPDLRPALNLCIQALKCIQTDREAGYFPEGHLLPGETESNHHE